MSFRVYSYLLFINALRNLMKTILKFKNYLSIRNSNLVVVVVVVVVNYSSISLSFRSKSQP